jgi:hypothetical protein
MPAFRRWLNVHLDRVHQGGRQHGDYPDENKSRIRAHSPPFNTRLLIGARLYLVRAAPDIQFALVEWEFSGDGKSAFPSPVHRDVGVRFLKTPASGNDW